ncbi:MAG: hypothetical protein H6747_03005 [Deltaproteobacteria bacterium]|nr:hypothetical protein [Deltaproteobacteria bacterium]
MQPSRRVRIACGIAALLLTAACSPVPDPSLGCSSDAQCPDGACVAGVCVPTADVGPGGDGSAKLDASDGKADAGPIPCTDDATCVAAFPELSSCAYTSCSEGVCSILPLPQDVTCTTGERCPAPGTCALGTCVAFAAPCDDQNPCTADQCKGDGCNHVAFAAGIGCPDDGLPCTDDRCKAGACAHPLREGRCLVDGVCADDGDPAPGLACRVCDATTPLSWAIVGEGPCDDGDACEQPGTCDNGGDCFGLAVDCDDNNACTDDGCDPDTGCIHLPSNATCTDTDPCTVGGVCTLGTCVPLETLDCDDQNPCTADSCSAGLGCVHAPASGPCLADADPCTDDLCVAGVCVAVPSVTVCEIAGVCVPAGGVSDANPCLTCAPSLDKTGWTVLVNVPCDDGDACTVLDACIDSDCIGATLTCKDASPCTADSCDTIEGCIFAPVDSDCDDGSACTTDDTCVQGACKGSPVSAGDCLDGNPCTADSCDDVVGCTHTPTNNVCDDGDPCTKGDFCTAGACVAGQIVCPCEFNSDCDDGNPCTIDICELGKGCANKAVLDFKPCDDGDACTGADACKEGICKGIKLECDDGNPCTKASCASSVGCVGKPLQGVACSDGSACTKGDVCLDGACIGTPKLCDDGNDCTIDSCSPATGLCKQVVASDGTACTPDTVPCTLDRCSAGACKHDQIAQGFCLISGACISGGASHPAKACEGCVPKQNPQGWSALTGTPCEDANACTTQTVCAAGGGCFGVAVDCNDGNPCTLDACDPGKIGQMPCSYAWTTGACDDGDACTYNASCVLGTCQGTELECDDENPCTTDDCSPSTGCFAIDVSDGAPCGSDGKGCTLDVCQSGDCKHLLTSGSCWIEDDCVGSGATSAANDCLVCAPKTNAYGWSPATGTPCDDGDVCTGDDACDAGQCAGEPAKACNDGNPCTLDSCNGGKGCTHTPGGDNCEDGDPCTTGDSCANGSCVPGVPVVCAQPPDNGTCAVAICLSSAGGCATMSSCPALHACVAGVCQSSPDGKTGGPVQVGLANAAQPLRPSLAWQESSTGPLGALPQLWIAAQRNGCDAALGVSAQLSLARIAPGQSSAAVTTLPATPPTGQGAWCAVQPVLTSHPNSFDAILLGWTEGGGGQSACNLEGVGGSMRLGQLGVGGTGIELGVAAACPPMSAATRPWRPAFDLASKGNSGGQPKLSALQGTLLRPADGGSRIYGGDPIAGWSGSKGSALPPSALGGKSEAPIAARPAVAPWTSGAVLLQPTRFGSGASAIAALTLQRVDSAGNAAASRTVVLTGAGVNGAISYVAAEAAFDPNVTRLGVVIGGVALDNGKPRHFLAFARVHPDQAASAAPKLITVIDGAVGDKLRFDTFRIATIPNEPHFLLAYAVPGSSVIKALRIEPVDDASFDVVPLGDIGGQFVSHAISDAADSSGGLSELRISPDGTRYSLAWEGNGMLWLRTAKIPGVN